MRKIYYKLIAMMLAIVLLAVFGGCSNVANKTVEEIRTIRVSDDYNEKALSTLFDFYDYEESSSYNRISAFKVEYSSASDGKTNMSLNNGEKIRTAYDAQYDYNAEMIYLSISTFDEDENIISVLVAEAYPIYFEDGRYDALFDIDGKKVFLSEIQSIQSEDCFFFSMTASLIAAKIVAALIVAAKVTAVVVGVIAIGGITYAVASLTKSKIEERTRTAEKEKSKKNPQYYYPAIRKGGKLLIAASPLGLVQASKNIVLGTDFWTPEQYMAKNLVVTASGGFVGPERDSNKDGYYYHYHLMGRVGGHSFYGIPSGGKY